MKTIIYLCISLLILTFSASAQNASSEKANVKFRLQKITIEPAIGIELMSDLVVSNLVQWNIKKRLSTVSYTSYAYNNSMQRDFNFINTDYNNSFSQKFGIGTSLYTKHSSHTLSFMAGIRYDAYKETLNNPEFEIVSASVSSVSPDFGLLYNIKVGKKKYFFSYRMYMPLYPYPIISSDTWSISDNMANFSFEFGLGIRLKNNNHTKS